MFTVFKKDTSKTKVSCSSRLVNKFEQWITHQLKPKISNAYEAVPNTRSNQDPVLVTINSFLNSIKRHKN